MKVQALRVPFPGLDHVSKLVPWNLLDMHVDGRHPNGIRDVLLDASRYGVPLLVAETSVGSCAGREAKQRPTGESPARNAFPTISTRVTARPEILRCLLPWTRMWTKTARVTRAPHIRRPLLAAGVALGLGVGSGCLLFVKDDPSSLGTTCHVLNEGSPCGACVTRSCQPKLDACCGDPTCAAALDSLDACITDFTRPACATYAGTPLSSATRADELRACVAGCAEICRTTAGTSVTACFASLANECVCTGGGDGLAFNDTVCNAGSIPSGVCCASYGWPNTGLTCSCQTYNCRPSSNGGCTCGLSNSNTGNHSCTGQNCCVDGSECACGPTPCSSYSKKVPSCGAATGAMCPGGGQVASCSASSGSRVALPDAGGHDG